MKPLFYSLLTCAALSSFTATAEPTTQHQPIYDASWAVGIGSYGLTIEPDDNDYAEDEFYGYNLSLTYASVDHIAVRAALYDTEHDDLSDLELSGLELQLLAGTGLRNNGFKAYGLLGFYSETMELASFEEDFSGFQLGGGIGYHWPQVSLDLSVAFRSTSDYEDFAELNDVMATSSSLNIAYRF
ncbi:outer membrane beta-barrel protein [Thalassotalea ponticola]|uniref:outer membrane beta-barrel protein n=1 Tax=Thalassotalea ponticola TaxID=1523392 RepID=UPI0025B5A670|nr:outer membrane beta-barrel protein [Thalassotalea ponticola]MDN3652259.1 outer membrane beta-barrel protein [Thalassotalea ponticola]